MHGEKHEFVPSEDNQENISERKDNVIEFPRQERPAEHAVEHILKEKGAHNAPVYLNESEFAKAQEELADFGPRQAEALLYIQKGMYHADIKHYQELSAKVQKLKRDIKFTEEVNLKGGVEELDKAA